MALAPLTASARPASTVRKVATENFPPAPRVGWGKIKDRFNILLFSTPNAENFMKLAWRSCTPAPSFQVAFVEIINTPGTAGASAVAGRCTPSQSFAPPTPAPCVPIGSALVVLRLVTAGDPTVAATARVGSGPLYSALVGYRVPLNEYSSPQR